MIKPEQDWILNDTHHLLHEKCKDIHLPLNSEQKELINRMIVYVDACYKDEDKKYNINSGIALAGPQVGLEYKVIYIHANFDDKEVKYLLANPIIIAESSNIAYLAQGEGCLSVNEKHEGIVKRKEKIIVSAIDLYSEKEIIIKAKGYLSICLQHEIDHINGIVYYDRILKTDPFYIDKKWLKY